MPASSTTTHTPLIVLGVVVAFAVVLLLALANFGGQLGARVSRSDYSMSGNNYFECRLLGWSHEECASAHPYDYSQHCMEDVEDYCDHFYDDTSATNDDYDMCVLEKDDLCEDLFDETPTPTP